MMLDFGLHKKRDRNRHISENRFVMYVNNFDYHFGINAHTVDVWLGKTCGKNKCILTHKVSMKDGKKEFFDLSFEKLKSLSCTNLINASSQTPFVTLHLLSIPQYYS